MVLRERIARALCRHEEADCWKTHLSDADAALAAMEEPSFKMVIALHVLPDMGPGGAIIRHSIDKVPLAWRSLIAAALKGEI